MSKDFWVSETLVWKITAESEEEARRVWQSYLDDVPVMASRAYEMRNMVLKSVEHETDWGE
jgi:hypothetical protein